MDADRYDLALAAMESAAFQLRLALEEYEKNGICVTDMRVMGGAVNSPLWLSIIAAVCGKNMHVMQVKNTACIGAACIAGVGAGVFRGYEQAAGLMNASTAHEPPTGEMALHYRWKFEKYQSNLNHLKCVYD